ncbi:MAG: Rab family GTPase [Promethearchaeota archaeon]
MEGSNEDRINLTYKICIFGDSGVGKTTLIDRYITNKYHEYIKSTLGATIHIKYFYFENGQIILQVWDFGGEDRFKFLIPSYAKGSSGGIFMFDLTNYESLTNIVNWLPEIRKIMGKLPILMVGSKLDLEQQRICKKEEALDLLYSHKLYAYLECSSKTGENVEIVFKIMLKEILNSKGLNHLKLFQNSMKSDLVT